MKNYANAMAIAALLASAALGDDTALQSQPLSRLSYILEQADKTRIVINQPDKARVTLQRRGQPVLRITNPLFNGQADGALLLWLDDQMPIVAASYTIRRNKELYREFSSLTELPVRASHAGTVVWTPPTGCFSRQPLPGESQPADNERLRLTQMKRAAERFSSKETRLLPTPLYRYVSKKYAVVDGAIFALVRANDPEVLILIEATRQESDALSWRYTLGRMNSFPWSVRLDDREICSLEGYWKNPKATSPYVEQQAGSLPSEIIHQTP